MNVSRPTLALALIFASAAVHAQDPQDPPAPAGQRGQWGGRGMMSGMAGRGVMGTVTEIAPNHFLIKTESGDLYTVNYSVNTRIMKAPPRPEKDQQNSERFMGLPITIKPTDIKVGDAIGTAGEVDSAAKSVGAVAIFQIDPETAKRMREMQANYGKTWLMGRVAAVNETTVTIEGGPDNGTHSFSANEKTRFRKRRDPITLGDIQMGDLVRVDGSMKNGAFLAAVVSVMGPRPERGNSSAGPQQ
jgi:preprotein translocase subunit YajC